MISDLLHIQRIREGDIKSFELLFRQYYSRLLWFSISITGRADVSEEIVQDIFYVLWRDREKLDILSSLKSYLYKSVKNNSLQFERREKLESRYSNENKDEKLSEDPHDYLELKELEVLIERILSKMPQRRAQIFRLHRFEGKKYLEIAQDLSISVKTVEAEMSKAIDLLRKMIER